MDGRAEWNGRTQATDDDYDQGPQSKRERDTESIMCVHTSWPLEGCLFAKCGVALYGLSTLFRLSTPFVCPETENAPTTPATSSLKVRLHILYMFI